MSDRYSEQDPDSRVLNSNCTRRDFVTAGSCLLGASLVPGMPLILSAQEPQSARASSSAKGVLTRLLGMRAEDIDLEWIPAENLHEVFEISSSRGRLKVRGSSGVALCRGAYTYLRDECSSMVTWGGKHIALPQRFQEVAARRVVCPYQFTQYLNPCTFGYSAPFWNWGRWERELDWMALHGINMALALDGQEAIWQQVWLERGITERELERHFTGPAYLAWNRMGNLNNFGGPLPRDWIEAKRRLQKKILDRMRELDIIPVVPGFSGFVPEGFTRVAPHAKTHINIWTPGMPRESKTQTLDLDQSELYKEIGAHFIQAYRREYGPTKYYLVDSFNELSVPVRDGRRYEDLVRFSRTVYDGIISGDPDGIWVMQGWIFRRDPKGWDDASVKAFLSSVPDERMIILDYTGDYNAGKKDAAVDPTVGNEWKAHHAFSGKRWMNGMCHTFGGNNNVKGNLSLIAKQPPAVLQSLDKGRLIGWCITPEGIESNEVVYELMTDIGWSGTAIEPEHWIISYSKARYGDCPPAMRQAWSLLMQSAYASHEYHSHHAWQSRPTLEPTALYVDSGATLRRAVNAFLSCAEQLMSSDLYRNDVIELVVQSIGGNVDTRLKEACGAHKENKPERRDQMASEVIVMLNRIDGLVSLREDRRLEMWTNAARSWALGADVQCYYEANLRRLITFWGWTSLNDYASRVWSGLICDYYAARWKVFFDALRQGNSIDFNQVEESWLSSPYTPSPQRPIHDLITEARDMLCVCDTWTVLNN
jgi:alpha-N-acetylglucosaminidase